MGWYNASWAYRVKITVLAAEVDADLTNYPVYVDLNDLPAGFHTNVNQTDARDIRVTTSDEVTEVPREVVFYTAASDTGELYFKGDVDSDTNTDFYIYYGNASATEPAVDATYGRNNVWTAYSGVWHLQESGNGTADEYKDSTGNGNDGTGNPAPAAEAYKVGNGQTFSPANTDKIDLGTVTTYNSFANISVEGWFNTTDHTQNRDMVRNLRDVGGGFALLFTSGGSIMFVVADADEVNYRSDAATFSDNTDYHLTATYAGGTNTMALYMNGATRTLNDTIPGTPENTGTNPRALYFGAQPDTPTKNYYGKMDEIRIAPSALTSTWASTNHSNQSAPGSFYNVGAQEEPVNGVTINVYDESTVTDVVGYEDETVTVADSVVNITLTTPPAPPDEINVFDEAFASDVIVALTIKPLKIDVFDSAIATDVVIDILVKPLKINVFDVPTVTDVPTVVRNIQWYNPTALALVAGSITSGILNDVCGNENQFLQLAETTGTPGFNYEFTFENVPSTVTSATIRGYYDGQVTHNIKIYQYNYNTTVWNALTSSTTDFPDETSEQVYHFPVSGSSDYRSGNQIKLAITHNTAGNPTHSFWIDEMKLDEDPAPSVYDESTITESVTVKIPKLYIEVFDSSAVTELDPPNIVVTTGAPDFYSINVYDEAFVSDVVTDTVVKPLKISVYDQPIVTDVIVDVVIKPLKISVSDTPVATDIIVDVVERPLYINVFDSSAVTDEVLEIKIPKCLISVFDTAVATDVVVDVLVNPLSINVFDQSLVSDEIVVFLPRYTINVFDESSVTDEPTVVVNTIAAIQINVYDEALATDAISLFQPTLKIRAYDTTFNEKAYKFILVDGELAMQLSGIFFIKL